MNDPVGPLPASWLGELKALLGPGGYLDAAADRAPFETDFRALYHGDTPLVALPDSTARVAELVRWCAAHRVAIVPQGGNTSYCGGATPRPGGRELVLSLRRMHRIRALDPAGDAMTAEAGCVLAGLQEAAAAAGRLLPLSLGSEGSCTLGGVISTNAGGTAVLRYGMMRALVLGLEVVLPDGRVLDQLTALAKDNTGYDLKQLFIGAEGTLGVVTAACLRLHPRPQSTVTAFAAVPDPAAALALLARLRGAAGHALSTFELLPRVALELVLRHVPGTREPLAGVQPWYVLVEFGLHEPEAAARERVEATLAAAIAAGEISDVVLAATLAQRDALWRLREEIPFAQRREGVSLKHDIAVAVQRVPEFIAAGAAAIASLVPGARLVTYGHLGDGSLHFNVSAGAGDDGASLRAAENTVRQAVHGLVARCRGSISAEHGIGQLKVAELERYEDPVALAVMRDLKRALDPLGIMNPGKVLAS